MLPLIYTQTSIKQIKTFFTRRSSTDLFHQFESRHWKKLRDKLSSVNIFTGAVNWWCRRNKAPERSCGSVCPIKHSAKENILKQHKLPGKHRQNNLFLTGTARKIDDRGCLTASSRQEKSIIIFQYFIAAIKKLLLIWKPGKPEIQKNLTEVFKPFPSLLPFLFVRS